MNLLDYCESVRLRDEGVERVALSNPAFVATMRTEAFILLCHRETVTIDDLRKRAVEMEIEPTHPNAWGAVFNSPEFEACGYTRSAWPSSHARTIKVWRLK